MSGWDFVFAGLQAMTYNQARNARKNLDEMKTTQERATAETAMLEAMRNFIFDIARDIKMAEANTQTYPQQVYIVSSTLGWRLHDSGLTPELFPEFSDKDYVFKTQNKIIETVKRCRQNLTNHQIQQSDLAVNYIVQMPLLLQAINAKRSSEWLQSTNSKWNKIQKKNSARSNSGCINIVAIIAVLFGASFICQLGAGISESASSLFDNETIQNIVGLPLLGISILVSLGLAGYGTFFFGKKLNKTFLKTSRDSETDSLRQKRAQWQQNLMKVHEWEEVKSTFGGDFSSEQFMKMYKERIAFLEPLMGKDYVKSLRPANR